jgi:hypothetical protein
MIRFFCLVKKRGELDWRCAAVVPEFEQAGAWALNLHAERPSINTRIIPENLLAEGLRKKYESEVADAPR